MTAKEWVLSLKEKDILTEGEKYGNVYIHLRTPCYIELTAGVTKQLKESYESDKEKGGVLLAEPTKINGLTHLKISRMRFLTNVSDEPATSYSPDKNELELALEQSYCGEQRLLPIRFHTHPTHSNNPINELFNYLYQCNTSEPDQIVSDYPVRIEDLNVLMPRCLILCNGNLSNRTFIGFYNGLIAPIEFQSHRQEQTEKMLAKLAENVSEWVEEGNNKWWLIGGGLLLAILIVKNNKIAIPLILLLVLMSAEFVNDKHSRPKYFAQLTTGNVIVELP